MQYILCCMKEGDVVLTKLRTAALSRQGQFILLSCIPLYFIVVGLFLQPVATVFPGIVKLMIEPDFLITDYFVVGGIGSAFMNAGLLALFCIWLTYFLDLDMEGHTVTSICLVFGFGLFGKNLMNVWSILTGTVVYALYHNTTLTRYLYVGFYGTALAPIITQILHFEWISLPLRMVLGGLIGIIIGFVLPPLATHVRHTHKGYSLYNVGFACGIIATIIVSVLKSFGVHVELRTIWYEGGNALLCTVLMGAFGGLMLFSLLLGGREVLHQYWSILKSTGINGTDYVRDESFFSAGFNMGVNGIFSTVFVLLVGGELNGPTIGGIMTIVGFGSTGKHIRNSLPIMLGVYCASLLQTWNINEPGPLLALLFCTTLAPIAGEFGVIAGIVAGFIHSSVVMNVGSVYAGMNLYNNGFAGGIVATFMVPVVQSVRERRARARGHVSL